ncbi:hypothetical protein PSAC2689_200065 [Paraburkholderia sacchari]
MAIWKRAFRSALARRGYMAGSSRAADDLYIPAMLVIVLIATLLAYTANTTLWRHYQAAR